MCGIVGYIGQNDAYPVLIEGLKKLEYRGYDSAGVALINGQDQLNVYKTKGKVSNLEAMAAEKDCSGHVGIAHTRWATHGEPSATNAHPHVSMSGDLALVHNGIIENYQVLKDQLIEKGYEFKSTTDTEVLVQLIDFYYQQNGKDLVSAVCQALNDAIGAYAIAVVEKENPSHLVAARQSSPLVVGVGKDNLNFYIASDATPIVEHTDKVVYLEDGQIADIRVGEELNIINLEHSACHYDIKTVDLDISKLSKGGFDHFMLKEIYDQPNCLKDCMSGRLYADKEHPENNRIVLSALRDYRDRLVQAQHIIIVACGTSWHAGLIGKQLIEKMCRKRVEVAYASEFRYGDPVIEPEDVVIAISQSGETADTLAAIKLAKEKGALIFGIVNGVGSSIARETDTGIYIHVIKDISRMFTYAHNFLYLGRGVNYPVAMEGALKLKEISYIHAEGYPAAEMKHGPIALVDQDMPIVFLATHHQLYEKIISNMQEVKSRNGRILAVVTEGDQQVKEIADNVLEVPRTLNALVPLLSVVPLQLLAYYVAVDKGLDVDMPRNLAKSVTVE